MRHYSSLVAVLLLAASIPALATVFATVHGVVHDPQHRPIAGAKVTLQAADSDFTLRAETGSDGDILNYPRPPSASTGSPSPLPASPPSTQPLTVASGTNPILHIPLPVAPTTQTVVVEGLESHSPPRLRNPHHPHHPRRHRRRPPAPAAPSAWR